MRLRVTPRLGRGTLLAYAIALAVSPASSQPNRNPDNSEPLKAEHVKGQPRATLALVVQKQISSAATPQPFGQVGLFEVVRGVTAINDACPSLSSGKGVATCAVPCDQSDYMQRSFLVRAPGADRVPGYEAPVSVEVTMRGCTLEPNEIPFTYKTLELALREVLLSDPALAQAVTGRTNLSSSDATFATLQPFEQSAPHLQAFAANRSASFNRFSRIMRDSEISARRSPNAATGAWKDKAIDYSVGTRSIQLNEAATRALGSATEQPLVPVTKNPLELFRARQSLSAELAKKQSKTPFDDALETELKRTTPSVPGKFSPERDLKAMDWGHINRATMQR